MICALTGEVSETPVVSIKTGHIFEKRAIEKYLEANEFKCPITQEPLTSADLLAVQVPKIAKPRPPTATSIPSLIATFQNEWDAVMLETFSLKKQLEAVRQELASALYQHDAACRVIARLIKERDEARTQLQNFRLHPAYKKGQDVDSMDVEGITEEVKNKMQEKSAELSKERKKREISKDLATAEDIKEYTATATHNVHKSTAPGVLCLDIHPKDQDRVATGGVDTTVIVFNLGSKKIEHTLSGHAKEISDVLFHPTQDVIFSSSLDKTAKVWTRSNDSGYEATFTAKHDDEVTGLSLHATGDFWVSGSLDKSWAFHDLATARTLAKISTDAGIRCLNFHPDGLILGTGTLDHLVKVWDVKTQKNVATFEGHKGKLLDIEFSENGYYLATAAEDNVVKLWDLRKLLNFHTIELTDSQVSSVAFDYSGTYLAVGTGSDVRVYMGRTMNHVATLSKHSKNVTDVKWGVDAQWLASTSMDRSLKSWEKEKKESRSKKRN